MKLTLLTLLTLALSVVADIHEAQIPSKFKSEESDLICHSSKPCYPRVFVPTAEFQDVEEDQEIPPGLHVQLDMATGKKRAKINVPSDTDAANEAIVVVPQSSSDDSKDSSSSSFYKPTQENIKPPKAGTPDDHTLFTTSITSLSSVSPNLEPLADLVHEAYWGAQLCSHPSAIPSLLSLLSTPHRAGAALVLGSALSNNPNALRAAVEGAKAGSLTAPILAALKTETEEVAAKRLLFALSQVVRDHGVRGEFVVGGGITVLRGVFERGGEEVKGRVAVVVDDAFLNSDMRDDKPSFEVVEKLRGAFCGVFTESEGEERVKEALEKLGCKEGHKGEL